MVFLIGMTFTGWSVSNDELTEHGAAAEGLGAYLRSGDFWEAISENWESEFLQMGSYVVLTVFLFQKGSAESKPIDQTRTPGRGPAATTRAIPTPHGRSGAAEWCSSLYENSLLILFAVLFAGRSSRTRSVGPPPTAQEQQLHGAARR